MDTAPAGMRRTLILFRAAATLVAMLCALQSAGVQAALATAVEFYNPALRHYFVTAYPEEVAALDAGVPVKGWARTGGEFSVYTTEAEGGVPVCRFFGTPGKGLNSHFYTADPAECAKVKTLPAWTFEAIAFYIPLPSAGSCPAATAPVYRNYFSDQISDANHRFTTDLTVHVRMPERGFAIEGLVMCAPMAESEIEADIVRFLEQATMGPTEALVAEVRQMGMATWLEDQLLRYETRFAERPEYQTDQVTRTQCMLDVVCNFTHINPAAVGWEFFRQALTGRDQLRIRFSYVLHQLLVMGQGGPSETYANRNFQQLIRDVAFSTYEDALYRYSVSPQLGQFQGWVNNVPERNGVKPNENYAREILQLLTTGVHRLHPDGVPLRDAVGALIPAYAQSDVTALSRVFTGFTFVAVPPSTQYFPTNRPNWPAAPMVPFDAHHDQGPKSLFDGALLFPAAQGAEAEVRAVVRALVQHPNTAPFISKQFIQRLVTSNPTPGYVQRVATVFADNGAGVRGDLTAIVRAILLDPEARGARKIDPEYGRLREPALLVAGVTRVLDLKSDGLEPYSQTHQAGMTMFAPATVFGYFPADYRIANGTLPGAEFGLYSTESFVERSNAVNRLLYYRYGDPNAPFAGYPSGTGTPLPTLTAYLASTANPAGYVERLNKLLFHGTMTAATRRTMTNAISALPASDAAGRARLGLYLALTSLDYQIQK